jgi:FixJ family two-component response regulator
MDTTTIHVVDDEPAIGSALQRLFRSAGLKAASYLSAEEFLQAWSPELPGCLICDVRMPGMSGLELQRELSRRGSTLPILFLTGQADVPMAVQAMRDGAADFMEKPFENEELLSRTRQILGDAEGSGQPAALQREWRERVQALTPRESEVMWHMASGKPSKLIARELGASPRTIEVHRARVFQKLRVSSLAELVRLSLHAELSSRSGSVVHRHT